MSIPSSADDYGGVVHVCFVCTGNICRSPIAEKILVAELADAGLSDRVRVTSAGTGAWHVGQPMDERSAGVLAAHGYDTTHVARQVDSEALGADLIVALDHGHLDTLRRTVPEPERVRLLRSFDPEAGEDDEVPDPYYGGPDGFTEVVDMVRSAMPGLVEYVRDTA
ncbi:low molecular weight protein-tyrosine-phosphatase [Pseudonocardia endophytica]|uniref:protein-tyrosine-phosphatase n=1 Tax=Pseudonocardia endophytica TaxID=401976 RepID=A0A4R1HQL3_PSEEN|nr:low molecular weight protein-tyrosine-phosphatase [Pseudonocardia endophytica]TCK24894.1 protein-tyrosine phosphatase [Pseudonocardia endophytica]